jgi:hypothetical protein
MTTLKLWHALRNPRSGNHPLFKRIHNEPDRRVRLNMRILIGGSIIFGMLLVCGLTYIVPPQFIRFYAALPIILPILYIAIVFGGTGKGVTLAGQISPIIAHEYEKDTFDTLSSTKEGQIGVYWTIINACLHRNTHLEDTNLLQIRVTAIALAFISFFLLIFYLNAWSRMAQEVFTWLPFVLYPPVIIYYIDYISSMVTSVLTAAIIASQIRKPAQAQVAAVSAFIILQIALYVLTYWLSLEVVPALFHEISYMGLPANLSMAGLSVVIYYGLREGVNFGLWRFLAWRLHAAPSELEIITDLQ